MRGSLSVVVLLLLVGLVMTVVGGLGSPLQILLNGVALVVAIFAFRRAGLHPPAGSQAGVRPIVTCPSCGTQNRLPIVQVGYKPVCGKCQTALDESSTAVALVQTSDSRGSGTAPDVVEPDDVAPMIVFIGGEHVNPVDDTAIQLDVHRRIAAERARRPNYASVALALCRQDGHIQVSLFREHDAKNAVWEGIVGRVPDAYLPKPPLWTLEAYHRAEPAVRAVVEAALAYK
jgi:hypothetical protein